MINSLNFGKKLDSYKFICTAAYFEMGLPIGCKSGQPVLKQAKDY